MGFLSHLFYPWGFSSRSPRSCTSSGGARASFIWLWIIFIGGFVGAAAYLIVEVFSEADLLRTALRAPRPQGTHLRRRSSDPRQSLRRQPRGAGRALLGREGLHQGARGLRPGGPDGKRLSTDVLPPRPVRFRAGGRRGRGAGPGVRLPHRTEARFLPRGDVPRARLRRHRPGRRGRGGVLGGHAAHQHSGDALQLRRFPRQPEQERGGARVAEPPRGDEANGPSLRAAHRARWFNKGKALFK